MAAAPLEDGFRIVSEDEQRADPEDATGHAGPVDGDAESLRDALVSAFNDRDLDSLMQIVADDVEVPDDVAGDGAEALAAEVEAIWQRSPGAVLTRGLLDGHPCAVGWLPDEEGCWSRAALVCMDFDVDARLLTVVTMPEDADALDRAEASEPTAEQLDEWADWAEWDRGEETVASDPERRRP